MQKPKSTKKNTKNFWTFFHTYRTKIALIAFVVVIPLTLVLTAYLGPLSKSRSVTFDRNITEQSEYISDFKNLDDLDDLNLILQWTTYRRPVDDGNGNFVNGSYTFNIRYETLNNKNISNVRVQLVLKPVYGDTQDTNNPVAITAGNTGSNFTVSHSIVYPFTPLWLVQINEPTVYIKITYTETFTGSIAPIEVTEYAFYSLSGIDPTNVE